MIALLNRSIVISFDVTSKTPLSLVCCYSSLSLLLQFQAKSDGGQAGTILCSPSHRIKPTFFSCSGPGITANRRSHCQCACYKSCSYTHYLYKYVWFLLHPTGENSSRALSTNCATGFASFILDVSVAPIYLSLVGTNYLCKVLLPIERRFFQHSAMDIKAGTRFQFVCKTLKLWGRTGLASL